MNKIAIVGLIAGLLGAGIVIFATGFLVGIDRVPHSVAVTNNAEAGWMQNLLATNSAKQNTRQNASQIAALGQTDSQVGLQDGLQAAAPQANLQPSMAAAPQSQAPTIASSIPQVISDISRLRGHTTSSGIANISPQQFAPPAPDDLPRNNSMEETITSDLNSILSCQEGSESGVNLFRLSPHVSSGIQSSGAAGNLAMNALASRAAAYNSSLKQQKADAQAKFTIEVAVFSDMAKAQQVKQFLQNYNYRPYIETFQDNHAAGNQTTMYRLFAGHFKTKLQAKNAVDQLTRFGYKAAKVLPLNN